jgi:hypothetical protein
MENLVAEKVVRVYADGTYEERRYYNKEVLELERNASQKTMQAVRVILEMHSLINEMENIEDIDFAHLYNKAINMVAQELDRQPLTVRDKLERQMKKKAKQVQELIKDCLANNDDTKLKTALVNTVKRTYRDEDTKAIEELFKFIKLARLISNSV